MALCVAMHLRAQEPWKKLTSMEKVLNMDQTKDVRKAYDTLMAQMNEYQEEQVRKWCARVDKISDEKLDQSLLTREDGRLCVNFDPLLVRLLRETKYFLLLKVGIRTRAAAGRAPSPLHEHVCDQSPARELSHVPLWPFNGGNSFNGCSYWQGAHGGCASGV